MISPIAQKFISSIILDEYEFKPKDFLRALISFSAYEEVMSFPPILDGMLIPSTCPNGRVW